MRGAGWTLEIVDDGTRIFSRSRDSSNLEENLGAQELIMDDEDNITLNQLATCQIGINNDDATETIFMLPQKSSPRMIVIWKTRLKLVNSTIISIS